MLFEELGLLKAQIGCETEIPVEKSQNLLYCLSTYSTVCMLSAVYMDLV